MSEYNILYLGPYQGPIACTVIPFGKGVCGTAAKLKQSQLVPNVHDYPGHIVEQQYLPDKMVGTKYYIKDENIE